VIPKHVQTALAVNGITFILQLKIEYFWSGASKGNPGDAKCVTEILQGGGKNKEVLGTKLKMC